MAKTLFALSTSPPALSPNSTASEDLTVYPPEGFDGSPGHLGVSHAAMAYPDRAKITLVISALKG